MINNLEFVERLRRRKNTQRYQQLLSRLLQREVILQTFPALKALPLPLHYPDGTPCSIEGALANRSRILLCAEPGAGAQIALAQLTARWCEQPASNVPLPFPIDVSSVDQAYASPIACLSALLLSQQEVSGQPLRLQLLISGWEELPATRREAWRVALCGSLPERVVQIVVVVPHAERLWQGFAPVIVGRPDLALQARWATLLASNTVSAEQLAKLFRPGDRLFDALMQIITVQAGMVLSRAKAVEAGLELLRHATQQAPSEMKLPLSFGIQHMLAREERLLKRAHTLVHSGSLSGLSAFREHERQEMALLANSLLNDAQPMLRVLWRLRDQDAAALPTIARCLLETQTYSPAWVLLLCRALGLRIREHAPEAIQLESALTQCLPAFDAALNTIAARPRPLRRLVSSTIQALPEAIAQPRLAWLAYTVNVHPDLAWDAAEVLIARALQGSQQLTFAPEDMDVMPRWAYVQCMSGPVARARLLQSAERALIALSALPAQRRLRVAGLLLDDTELPQLIRMSAIELLRGCDTAESLSLLRNANSDSSPILRATAMQALERLAPEQAQDVLFARLTNPAATEAQQDEVLRALADLRDKAFPLAEQFIIDDTLALHTRLALISLLGRSRNGLEQLMGLLSKLSHDSILHAAVLLAIGLRIAKRSRSSSDRHLVWSLKRRRGMASLQWRSWLARRRHGDVPDQLLPQLIAIVRQKDINYDVRAAACTCLGLLGGSETIASLKQLLEQAQANVRLSLTIADALGATRDEAAIEPLTSLLDARAFARLRDSVPSGLLRESGVSCLLSPDLPLPIKNRLELHLAHALSEAEKPSTLTEFLLSEAELLRTAAARALACIGGFRASAALAQSLRQGPNASSTPVLTASLGACGTAGVVELHTLLADEKLPYDVRLACAQALGGSIDAEETALRALANPRLGGMLRGMLAVELGKRKSASAGSILRLIVQDVHNEAYLRMQALEGLALLEDPSSEAFLLQMVMSEQENEHLRGAAASALAPSMSYNARHKLLTLLYADQLPMPVIVGGLHALGRANEHELLALTMRYGLDTRAAVVKAAITAMTAIGDACITPMLIRISQNPNADMMTRLNAIGGLLQFDAQEYLSLLNSYLRSGQVLIQIQALEHMLSAGVSTDHIAALIEQGDLALALRQRVLTALSNNPAARPTMLRVFNNTALPVALRTRAASALGVLGTVQDVMPLADTVHNTEEVIALRLACMQSLAILQPSKAARVFAMLLEQPDTTAILRYQARTLLMRCIHTR